MNGNFKKCAQGHYYSATLDHCPYCPGNNESKNNFGYGATMGPTDDENRTMDVQGLGIGRQSGGAATEQFKGTKENRANEAGFGGTNDETKTIDIGGGFIGSDGETIPTGGTEPNGAPSTHQGGTIFITDDGFDPQGQPQVSLRQRRKLVGWLVSYTLDETGIDFKLYEGKNIIGRNANCQITIADKTVSGNQALILFRAGKYSITDQQSTPGTFVNNEDIGLTPWYLKDGDVIRMGQTLLRFRSSL